VSRRSATANASAYSSSCSMISSLLPRSPKLKPAATIRPDSCSDEPSMTPLLYVVSGRSWTWTWVWTNATAASVSVSRLAGCRIHCASSLCHCAAQILVSGISTCRRTNRDPPTPIEPPTVHHTASWARTSWFLATTSSKNFEALATGHQYITSLPRWKKNQVGGDALLEHHAPACSGRNDLIHRPAEPHAHLASHRHL